MRGVWYYQDVLYAVRDDDTNDPPTAARLYKATTTGWELVSLGQRIAFDAGSVEPTTGQMMMGATSTAMATLGHVTLASGSWSGGDAAGTFWLSGVTGTFQDNENLQQSINGTDTTVAVADGAAVANALPAGGRYEFVTHNFLGQAATRRMYGVNGAGKAFSFDGTQFVEIASTHDDDRPTHIAVWRNHLALAFRGGSLIVSEPGNPDGYVAANGAFEVAGGQEINGLIRAGPGNLLVVGDDRMQVLYGNDSADVQLVDASDEETGGVEWTVQAVGSPIYLDNRGLRRFSPSDTYENFRIGTMTSDIQPFIETLRNEGVAAVASQRVRSRDQYRVWFDSGIGLCVYVGRRQPEISFLDYGADDDGNKVIPRCSVSAEDANRVERVYFGTDSGFVYEAGRGRSFDGRKIQANIRLPLNHAGAPSIEKSFSEADIYVDLAGRAALSVSALFDDGLSPGTGLEVVAATGGGGLWDESIWDTFYWDASLSGFITVDMLGSGRNVSLLIRSEEKTELPHILNAVSLYWMPEGARVPAVAV